MITCVLKGHGIKKSFVIKKKKKNNMTTYFCICWDKITSLISTCSLFVYVYYLKNVIQQIGGENRHVR